jgi:hypothetical protein
MNINVTKIEERLDVEYHNKKININLPTNCNIVVLLVNGKPVKRAIC